MSSGRLRLLNVCCLMASAEGYACSSEKLPPYGATVSTDGIGADSTGSGTSGSGGSDGGGSSTSNDLVTSTIGTGCGGAATTGTAVNSGGDPSIGGGESGGGTETASGGSSESSIGGGTSGLGTGGGGGSTGGSGGTMYSTDRDEFFGDSRCTADLDLCEDFEQESLDTGIWSVRGPAPTIDESRAARGSRSAHFHTVDNGLSYIEQSLSFPAPGNRYFARIFVYFDSMPSAPEWAHWSIAGAIGSGTEAEIRVGGQYDNSINRFGVGSDYGPTGDWTNLDEDPGGSPSEVPVDEWLCVEWLHDGGANETRFWWDGVEHPSLFTSAVEHGGDDNEPYVLPEFESVWVGWWLYQSNTTPGEFDVWIDEVAFDDERIGCSR